MIDLPKYFFLNDSHCFSFSFLWRSQSCLQFFLYFIHLKSNFRCRLINQFIMPLTTITSRQAASSRQTFPLFPGELQFSEEEQHRGNREKMKKATRLMYVHDKDGARWELLCSPHVDKRAGSQSVWRQLENSPEPGLIESLSSSLCASWAVGDQRGATQRATLWWDLEEIVGNV